MYNFIVYTQIDTIPKITLTAPKVTTPQVTVPQVTVTPPTGFLSKLTQALQFRKNARAREQARVLAIIDHSGLKDSLRATERRLDAIDSARRTVAEKKEESDIRQVLAAIDSLKARLTVEQQSGDDGSGGGDDAGGEAGNGSGVDDQAIQDMVNKIVSTLTPAEQANLLAIRQILQRGRRLTDTVVVNDSLSNRNTYRVRNKIAITGFYPFEAEKEDHPDLRLIDEVAWYSAGFVGATGHLTGGNDWLVSGVLDSARAAGCAVTLCVQSQNAKNIAALLRSPNAQQVLIADILAALDVRHADGVNILFDNPPPASSAVLTAFIIALRRALGTYRLSIRIPAYATDDIYDLPTLNVYTDRFLVDFTEYQQGLPGPLAPLAGVRNNDLKTCISRYLNIPIPPAKLVVCLPYFGVGWTLRSGKWMSPESIPYNELRSSAEYQQVPTYDPLAATERLDIQNKAGVVTRRVWYDDAVTLAAKYDFILQNGLGGVSIQSLGDDIGYGDLWDVMAGKLARVDTTSVALNTQHWKKIVLDDWQWSWVYINAKLEQYGFLFSYPCETSFPKVLVKKWTEAGVKNNDRNMVREEETTLFGVLCSVLAVLFVGGVLLFINRIRRVGDRWKGTKPLAAVLIVLFILLTIAVFMYLFLDTRISLFGVSDNPADCFDFPLGTLFTVIFTGIAIGVLITRFLLFPLMKKDDIP